MNGISLKESITLGKKQKVKDNIRFFLALILSNALVYFLCQNQTDTKAPMPRAVVHSGYSMITLPAISFLTEKSFENSRDKRISIVDQNGKIIISNAYFIKKIKPITQSISESGLDDSNGNEINFFNIEIPDQDFLKLTSAEKQKYVLVKPVAEVSKTSKKIIKDQYEISI